MDKVQTEAMALIMLSLKDVSRFGGDHHITVNNSVYDHIQGLIKIIMTEFPEGELRQDLLMRAVFHDAGELAGEIDTLSANLEGNGIDKDLKEEFEGLVFKVFAHFAVLCVLDGKAMRFVNPLALMRKMVAEKLGNELTLEGLTNYLRLSYKQMVRHSKAFRLEQEYDRCVEMKSPVGRIFKVLDLIEGGEFFVNNASDTSTIDPAMPEVYDTMCRKALEGLDLPVNVVARLENVSKKYKEFVNV
jgi:hypothetical protein